MCKTTTSCAPACMHTYKQTSLGLVDISSRAGPEYLNICSVCWHSILRFEYPYFIFFVHLASPAKRFSACLPGWTSAPADRSPMKDVRADLYHACISWKIFYYERACHTSNLSVEKMRHVNGTLCYHKTECDACVFFTSTVPSCERKS